MHVSARHRCAQVILGILAALTEPNRALSAELTLPPFTPTAALVQLSFGHRSSTWRYDDQSLGITAIDEIDLDLAESLAEHTMGGIKAGIVDAHQRQRAETDVLNFSGSTLGAFVQTGRPLPYNLTALFALSYQFYKLSDATSTREYRWQWHDWEISAGLSLPLADGFFLDASATYREIRGYEDTDTHGAAARSVAFRNDARSGTATSLLWRIDATGIVGATYRAGTDHSWSLFFGRAY